MIRKTCLALMLAASILTPAQAATLVPEGNRNTEQPAIPGGSAKRTAALKTTYEAKFQKVYALLKGDSELRSKIRKVASQYGIDPVHIVGAIVGEHTYNVDAYDRLQTYYVKALAYTGQNFTFALDGENVTDFVRRPQFARCESLSGSYAKWTCRENVWNSEFRGRRVDGISFPNNRFSAVFFQPFYAGQTFGLGQLNPLTALQLSDLVSRISGYPALDAGQPQKVYQTIMDPDKSLAYVAAAVKNSIDAYASIAGFDISKNPGLTATLYNLGSPEARARALKRDNEALAAAGNPERLPEENYYGWLVNDKIGLLRALF